MKDATLLIVSLWIAIPALIIVLFYPLLKRKVKRNGLYGFRIAATMSSDKAWYELNEYAGKWMIRYSITLPLIGALLLFSEFGTTRGQVWWLLCVPIAVHLVSICHILVYAWFGYDPGSPSE